MMDPDCIDCVTDDVTATEESEWQAELDAMEQPAPSTNGQGGERHVDVDLHDLLESPTPGRSAT
jgi:hypothetical protein